jgi:hypothetical protein
LPQAPLSASLFVCLSEDEGLFLDSDRLRLLELLFDRSALERKRDSCEPASSSTDFDFSELFSEFSEKSFSRSRCSFLFSFLSFSPRFSASFPFSFVFLLFFPSFSFSFSSNFFSCFEVTEVECAGVFVSVVCTFVVSVSLFCVSFFSDSPFSFSFSFSSRLSFSTLPSFVVSACFSVISLSSLNLSQ